MTSFEGSNPSFSAHFPDRRRLRRRLASLAALQPTGRARQHWPAGLRTPSDASGNRGTLPSAPAYLGRRRQSRHRRRMWGAARLRCAHRRRGGRAVECGGLENRFGPLGPTRVQIPPPPLEHAKPRTGSGVSAPRTPASFVRLKPLETAGNWRSLARNWRTPAEALEPQLKLGLSSPGPDVPAEIRGERLLDRPMLMKRRATAHSSSRART
jgi:hypothetical protein